MFEIVDNYTQDAVIKVIGVGGGGGNAVSHMLEENLEGVDFVCANTDVQALNKCGVSTLLPIGSELTKGLGAGANPQVGQQAALEDRERIQEQLHGADMVFITAGMGGGTGTGAAPVVAEISKELGILTVAVVTKPFRFEGGRRQQAADQGIRALRESVDSLITIPNDKLVPVLGSNMTLLDAFKAANDVLLNAVQGISELITKPGLINVDFADVRTVMAEMGLAMMGSGSAVGEERAREAAETALQSPLLEDVNLTGAKGILVNITAGMDMSIGEFDEVGSTVRDYADDDATVVVGTVIDADMRDELKVTVVATGIGGEEEKKTRPAVRKPEMEVVKAAKVVGSDVVNGDAASSSKSPAGYGEYDNPTVIRKGAKAAVQDEARANTGMDYLDIPAFLRKQND
ncbi:MAG: cell division protein FtsZ [Pseudomonadota bacterium]